MKQKFKYLHHRDIDFEKWDLCVASTEAPQPYGFSWYLNWLAPSWDAVIYGDYDVIMPIFPQRKFGLNFTTRPFGTQSTGPFAKIQLSSKWVEAIVNYAMSTLQYGEFFLAPQTPLPKNWTSTSYANYVLHTLDCYEGLYSGYSTQNKRSIKKANKVALEWAQWSSVDEAISLWKVNTQEQTNITDENIGQLKKLLEFCHYQNRGKLYAVRDEYNQLAGAQFWIHHHGRSTLLLNATSPWGKDNGISAWLIDQHIRTLAGTDYIIDFEGSSIEGLERFYKGFGAHSKPFYMHVENKLPFWARSFKPKTTREEL